MGGTCVKAPDRIETTRLILRKPRIEDVETIYARYACDLDVTKYLSWPIHRSVEDTKTFVRFSDLEWERWPAGPYLIESKADQTMLGGTGLGFESPTLASTGYVFARDAWGLGYATEALSAMVTLAQELGVRSLYAAVHPEHGPSQRVLEKGGFLRDGVQRTEFPNLGSTCDALRYARSFD